VDPFPFNVWKASLFLPGQMPTSVWAFAWEKVNRNLNWYFLANYLPEIIYNIVKIISGSFFAFLFQQI